MSQGTIEKPSSSKLKPDREPECMGESSSSSSSNGSKSGLGSNGLDASTSELSGSSRSEERDLTNDQRTTRNRWADTDAAGKLAAAGNVSSKGDSNGVNRGAKSTRPAILPALCGTVGAPRKAQSHGGMQSSSSRGNQGQHKPTSNTGSGPGKLQTPVHKGACKGGKAKGLEDKPVTFHKKVKSSGYGFIQPKVELGKSKPAAVKVGKDLGLHNLGLRIRMGNACRHSMKRPLGQSIDVVVLVGHL